MLHYSALQQRKGSHRAWSAGSSASWPASLSAPCRSQLSLLAYSAKQEEQHNTAMRKMHLPEGALLQGSELVEERSDQCGVHSQEEELQAKHEAPEVQHLHNEHVSASAENFLGARTKPPGGADHGC